MRARRQDRAPSRHRKSAEPLRRAPWHPPQVRSRPDYEGAYRAPEIVGNRFGQSFYWRGAGTIGPLPRQYGAAGSSGSQVMPSPAHRLETDLGIAAVRNRVAQVGIET